MIIIETVNCDKCKKDFPIKLKEKKHGQGITETYFSCPHCKEKYIAFVTDAEARKGQREMKALNLSLSKEKDPEKKNKLLNDIRQKKFKLKLHMDRLKQEVASK